MEINNKFIALALVGVGYIKYKKFEKFINTLQLGLEVLEIENGYAVVSIDNLNTKHIPYSFSSIDLIVDKQIHAATNTESSTNLSIVPFSQIPINFKLLQALPVEELAKSEVSITYNFFGLEFKRLYKPSLKENENIKTDHTSCGCN